MRRTLACLMLVFTACGGSGGDSNSATPSGITLHGSISRLSGAHCEGLSSLDDIYFGNKQLTFRDGASTIIGTTTTDAGTLTERTPGAPAGGCIIAANYSIDLPKTDFYQVELSGGIPLVQADPISYADLASKNFEYDLQINNG